MIKKVLLFSFLIILIPFTIVSVFIRNENITFNFSSNSVVRVYRKDIDKIDTIPIEEYIVGVLAGEMPVNFEMEALKAQAVASRSYVMTQIERNKNKDYDVVDTVTNQVYLDNSRLMTAWKESYTNNMNKIKTAVIATKGQYASYKGDVAETLFFSTSPGVTENSEEVFTNKVEYLRSVKSKWDEISPVYTYITTLSLSRFYENLGLEYKEKINVKILKTTSTGRIKEIEINGKNLSGNYVCSKLKLKSTFFEITQEQDKVIIKTKGYGHGVGMSQYGAQGMAKEGYKYDEILKHYYKGIEIKKF